MARVFAITAANTTIQLDATGVGEVSFTVTNSSKRTLRGRARVVAKDSTQEPWLSIAGETERDFPPDATQQFTLRVQIPRGSPAGTYRCAVSVASIDNPDEEYAEGPVVAFEVKPSEIPPKKFPWWIIIVAVAVIIVVAVVIYLVTRPTGFPIPSVANLTETQAKQKLEQLCDPAPCLTVKIGRKGSESVEKGKAIETDPPEGSKVKRDSEVTLFISEGRGKVVLKPVAGMKEALATQSIESLCAPQPCVKVQVFGEASDEFDNGEAIRTEPPAGSPVEPGSTVTLIVSQIVASGTFILGPNGNADLDNAQLNVPADKADLVFISFSIPHPFGPPPPVTSILSPGTGAKFVRRGTSPPHAKGCLDASTSIPAIDFRGLAPNEYICVQTSERRVCEIKIVDANPRGVRIEFNTWNRPSKLQRAQVGPTKTLKAP